MQAPSSKMANCLAVPSQVPKAVIIVGQLVKAYSAMDATVKLAEASQYATATIANAKVRAAAQQPSQAPQAGPAEGGCWCAAYCKCQSRHTLLV